MTYLFRLKTYENIKHHLMGLNIIIRRGLIYLSITVVCGFIYYFLFKYSNLLIIGGIVQRPLYLIYLSTAFIALILHGLLSIIVLINNPKRVLNRVFSLMSAFIFIWVVGCFIQTATKEYRIALLVERIVSRFYVFIPALFIHTFHEILNIKNMRILIFSYLGAFGLFLLSFNDLFINGVSYVFGARYLADPGKLYFLFPTYICVISLISMSELISKRRKASGYYKNQLDYMLLAGSSIITGVFFTFLMTYKIVFTPFDEILNIVYGITIGYAILKHRLMNINIIIRKGIIYSVLIGFLTGLYLLGLYLISNLLGGLGTRISMIFSALLIILFAIILQPLRDRIQEFIDNVFYRGKYDYQKTLKELSFIERSIAGLDEMLDKVLHTIVDVIKIRNASLYVLEKMNGQFILKKAIKFEPPRVIEGNEPIIAHLRGKKEALIIEGLTEPSNEIKDFADSTNAAIIFPVIYKDELIGILTLGGKLSEEIYSDDDINLLSTLCNQIGISIENAMLYEDAMETQKQLFQADKLATMGALAAGLAHEIKNPIAAIKGFAQVIEKAVEEGDKEVVRDFKEVIPRQLDRINEIVEKLLTLSKPPKPIKETVNVNTLLEDIIRLVEKQAMKQRIEIISELGQLSKIIADPGQLTQAFLNLILNAMQSMPEGGRVEIRTNENEKSITIEIKDCGVGIEKDKMSKIFDPFYTTKEGGSGIGLAVTNKIIKDHHGEIKVESEVGKGTIFCIIFPQTV